MSTNRKSILSVSVDCLPDLNPDTSYLDQDGEEERKAQFERGLFSFVGIRAKATIILANSLTQTITSGGLWGIEDDSDRSHLLDIAKEELDELRDQLIAMGFSRKQISAATQDVELQ